MKRFVQLASLALAATLLAPSSSHATAMHPVHANVALLSRALRAGSARVHDIARAHLDRIARIERAAGVSVPTRVPVGDVARAVGEEATQEHADLVVIGRGSLRGRSFLPALDRAASKRRRAPRGRQPAD